MSCATIDLRIAIMLIVIHVSGLTDGDVVSGQERDVFLQIDRQSHNSEIRSIVFSSNDHLCSAGLDKQVICWSVNRHPKAPPQLRYDRTIRWDIQRGTLGAIYALDAVPSASDPLVAFAGQSERGGYNEIVWASPHDGRYQDYRHSALVGGTGDQHDSITSLSLSRDGRFTLTTDINLKTVLWSPQKDPTLIREYNVAEREFMRNPFGEPTCFSAIAGNLIIVPELIRSEDRNGQRFPVWKLSGYQLAGGQPDQITSNLFAEAEHQVAVTALAASRNGRFLASAEYGTPRGGIVHVWDLQAKTHRTVPIPKGLAISLSFSETGEILAVGTSGLRGQPHPLVLLSTQNLGILPSSRNASSPIVACATSPDGSLVAYSESASNSISLIDRSRQDVTKTREGLQVQAVAENDDTGTADLSIRSNAIEDAQHYRFFPDALKLVQIPSGPQSSVDDGKWSVQLSKENPRVLQVRYRQTEYLKVFVPASVTCRAWVLGKNQEVHGIVVGTSGGDLFAYRLGARNYARRYAGHTGAVTSISLSSAKNRLVTSSTDGTIRYWSLDGWNGTALPDRWGIELGDGTAEVTFCDDRGPLFLEGVKVGDEIIKVVWDDQAANLGLGDEQIIEGRPRRVVKEPADVFNVLQQFPRDASPALYLRRNGKELPTPVQSVDAWRSLLAVYVEAPHWIAWNPSGYYASSPGGERLVGWLVNGNNQQDRNGIVDLSIPKEAPVFHSAIQFRKRMYRPDVIQRLLATGSLEAALAEASQAQAEAALAEAARAEAAHVEAAKEEAARAKAAAAKAARAEAARMDAARIEQELAEAARARAAREEAARAEAARAKAAAEKAAQAKAAHAKGAEQEAARAEAARIVAARAEAARLKAVREEAALAEAARVKAAKAKAAQEEAAREEAAHAEAARIKAAQAEAARVKAELAKAAQAAKNERPKPVRIVEILPPRVRILKPRRTVIRINNKTITITAEAISDSRRPVESMELLINGSPDPETVREVDPLSGVAHRGIVRDVRFERTWQVELGKGRNEFRVRAIGGTGEDTTYGLSDPVHVIFSEEKPTMYLLAIGISNYPGRLQLKYADNDAEALIETMQNNAAGGDRPFEKVVPRTIINEKATKAGIRDGLKWLKNSLSRGDLGIVFFAGHGMRSDTDDKFYLAPVDIDPERIAQTGVSEDIIRKFCKDTCGGKRRLLVVDACYSGALRPEESFRDLDSDDFGVFVMTSSSENERSLESDNFRSGIFSKWLNDGLRGFANWDDEFVDHWELGDYVYKRVKDYVKENHHATQVPVIMRGRSPFNLTKPGLVRLAGR